MMSSLQPIGYLWKAKQIEEGTNISMYVCPLLSCLIDQITMHVISNLLRFQVLSIQGHPRVVGARGEVIHGAPSAGFGVPHITKEGPADPPEKCLKSVFHKR